MVTQPLFLAKHAFVCQADSHLVFLDLQQDKYLCLDREQSLTMQSLFTEHNGTKGLLERSAALRRSETRIVQAFVERGLIVQDETSGKPAMYASTEAPLEALGRSTPSQPVALKAKDIRNFFAAASFASIRLRWGSIERTVRSIERRKLASASRATFANGRETVELVAIFRALRLYYPREYLCLFDSFALVRFLASYGMFPQWVFGVKLEPFSAHCWVQEGGLVLNDTVERVRQFTPIMVI